MASHIDIVENPMPEGETITAYLKRLEDYCIANDVGLCAGLLPNWMLRTEKCVCHDNSAWKENGMEYCVIYVVQFSLVQNMLL